MNIAELHEDKNHPPPKILIYGDVGCGKTVLALTLGEGAQILDCDMGLRSGFSLQDDFTDARRAVDVKQFPETGMPKIAIAFPKMKRSFCSKSAMKTNELQKVGNLFLTRVEHCFPHFISVIV